MKEFKLDSAPKIETGFKAPDGYFDHFAKQMMEQLPKEEPKVIPLFQKRKVFALIAAAVIAFLFIVPIFNSQPTITKEIDSATLENYLSYQTNISQYDLINALDEDDINTIKKNVAIEESSSLESETIEDILVSNGNLEHLLIE
jgi:hypothetical protein